MSGGPGKPAALRGLRRVLWFVGLYAASFAAFTALVYLLRVIVRG
ncbi:hypothetical protein [Methylobacterium nigriterrae]